MTFFGILCLDIFVILYYLSTYFYPFCSYIFVSSIILVWLLYFGRMEIVLVLVPIQTMLIPRHQPPQTTPHQQARHGQTGLIHPIQLKLIPTTGLIQYQQPMKKHTTDLLCLQHCLNLLHRRAWRKRKYRWDTPTRRRIMVWLKHLMLVLHQLPLTKCSQCYLPWHLNLKLKLLLLPRYQVL